MPPHNKKVNGVVNRFSSYITLCSWMELYGLLCSNSVPEGRPSMQQVLVQYLEGYIQVPELSSLGISSNNRNFSHKPGFSDVAESLLSEV